MCITESLCCTLETNTLQINYVCVRSVTSVLSHSLQPYGHQEAHQAPLSMGFSRQKLIAKPSSRGSSQPRDGNCISYVSCIAGRFFTC